MNECGVGKKKKALRSEEPKTCLKLKRRETEPEENRKML